MHTPEEKSLLENIKALVEELEQVEGGEPEEAAPETDEVDKAEDELTDDDMNGEDDDEPTEDEVSKAVKKALADLRASRKVEKATASDPADARLTDGVDEEKIVAKAIAAALSSRNTVRKSADITRVEQKLDEVVAVMKSLAQHQQMVGSAVEDMFAGMGIADSVMKSKAPVSERPSSREAILSEVRKSIGMLEERVGQPTDPYQKQTEIRKDLAGVMAPFFGQQK